MSGKRVSFSCEDNDQPTIIYKHGSGAKIFGNRKKVAVNFSRRMCRGSKSSPAGLLRCLGTKVARVLRFMSMRRKSSRKVSSACLTRSRSLADTIDSQRAEAIEDCIEFLNSSSSLQRSSSVSSSTY